MKIIVKSQEEAVKVAHVLQRAAGSVKLDMRLSDIEQDSLSIQLCAMRDSVEVEGVRE